MVTETDPGGNKLDSLWATKQSLEGYLRGKRIPGRFVVLQVNCDIKMIPEAMENNGQGEKKE